MALVQAVFVCWSEVQITGTCKGRTFILIVTGDSINKNVHIGPSTCCTFKMCFKIVDDDHIQDTCRELRVEAFWLKFLIEIIMHKQKASSLHSFSLNVVYSDTYRQIRKYALRKH